jgi:hypothetical protein
MAAIVTTHYRYKRLPRKRKAVALEVPAVVKASKKGRRMELNETASQQARSDQGRAGLDDRSTAPSATAPHKSAIVTARKPGKARTLIDWTPDPEEEAEHNRRANAADALFREIVRCVAGKERREP